MMLRLRGAGYAMRVAELTAPRQMPQQDTARGVLRRKAADVVAFTLE